MAFDLKSDFSDLDKFMARAIFYYYRENDELKLSVAKLDNKKNERVDGNVIDLQKFNYAEIYLASYRLLDEHGNILPLADWETAPTYYGYKYYPNTSKITFGSLNPKDGEYYCIFVLKDVAGNFETSSLIKVGG